MADGPVRDFGMTPTGGWASANGDFVTVAGSAAVPQGIQIRVFQVLREVFTDEAKGVDWLGKILVKNPDPLEVRAELATAALDTPDVTDVQTATLQGPDANRQASINMQVATLYSAQPIGVQAQVP